MTMASKSPTVGAPIVEVSDLRKTYGGRTVVAGVSLAVEEGEIFGILGPNGAGKEHTVECIEGPRVPDGGRMRVAGLDPIADHAEVTRVLGASSRRASCRASSPCARRWSCMPPSTRARSIGGHSPNDSA